MAIQDVNQDGRADLVILIPYEKIKVLLQKPDGSFDEEDVDPPGGAIEQPWLASRLTWKATANPNCSCRKTILFAPSCSNSKQKSPTPPTSRHGSSA